MTMLRPRTIGIVLGLALAAVVLVLYKGQRTPPPAPTGPIMSECDGVLGTLAIQYVDGADFALSVYRSFLPQLPADVRVYVLCPDQAAYDQFRAGVGAVSCQLTPVPTGHAMTPWSRDRWACLTAANGGSITLLSPREEEGADNWPTRKGDQQMGEDVARAAGAVARRSSLFFDGGDFVTDAEHVFVIPAVPPRNLQITVESRDELVNTLTKSLGRNVVLLDDAPPHHGGMYMMVAGGRTVVVGDPSLARPLMPATVPTQPSAGVFPSLPGGADLSPEAQAHFDAVARQLQSLGYRVVRIPTVSSPDGRTYLTYLNGLIDEHSGHRTIYMPTYRNADALNAAAARVWQSLGYEVRPVDCTDAYIHFGCLHCLVNVVERH